MNELTRWKAFWNDKTVPLHQRDEEDYYERHAAELKVLFGKTAPESVLEIGCGNGALYTHLGFDRARLYTGVDFSEAMVEEFRKRHPNVSLVATSGHAYKDDRGYDLIFSNGVIQYFDRAMLAQHFANAAAMLAPGGRLVCASVPWRFFRKRYLMGGFSKRRRSLVWSVLHFARYFHRDALGQWYEWSDLENIAREHGLAATFHGSLHYPYRFHAVLQASAKQG